MALIDKAITKTLQKQYRRETFKRTQTAKRNTRAAVGLGSGGVASIAGQTFPASGAPTAARVPFTARNAGRLSDAKWVPDSSSIAISSISIGGAGGGVGVGAYSAGNGIQITGSIISLRLASGQSALSVSGAGLTVNNAIAGAGLTIHSTTKVLSIVGASGGGIQVNADSIQVDSTVVRTSRRVDSGVGLTGGGDLSANRTLAVGTGFGLLTTADTVYVNEAMTPVWTGIHQFNARPEINNNLRFEGGNRTIEATDVLTLAPEDDLYLSPGLNVVVPMATPYRTPLFQDSVTGILGFSNFHQGGNVRQLTIGALKADEIFVRFFTADEVRVTRGEEMWSRSYGIVETSFLLPAIGATVDVWFEEAPDLATAKLFLNDNWLISRTIDLDGPNLAMRVYFQVVGIGVDGYVQREDAQDVGDTSRVSRQQWRIRRMFGGATGAEINKGIPLVDLGKPQVGEPGDPGFVPGQGVLWLSALAQSGGPFFDIQTFTHVDSNVPQFETKTRMGNLKNKIDYITDTFGFATGNNLSLLPSAGFSGATVDEEAGMRLFNTDLKLYDGNIKIFSLTPERGLDIREDHAEANRNISWVTDIDDPTDGARASISGGRSDIGSPYMSLELYTTQNFESGVEARTHIRAIDPELSTDAALNLYTRKTLSTGVVGSQAHLFGNEVLIEQRVGIGIADTHANWPRLVVGDNGSAVDRTAGVVIRQSGSGDAVLHFYLSAASRWYTIGIDNNDSDKFKISASESLGTGADIFVYNPLTGATTINGFDPGGSLPAVDIAAGDGITVVGPTVSVDSTVLRTARLLTAGDGLTGGGDLSADRTFNVDGTVVRTARILTAGAGLTGGGTLGADRTFDIGAGDGITVNANDVAVNSTVVRTSRILTAGLGMTGGGDLSADRTFDIGAGDGITVSASSVAVNSTVVRTTRTITGTGAIGGGGDLSANRVLSLTLATPSGLNQTAGLALDDSVAGAGLAIASKVLSVNVGTGLQIVGDAVEIDAGVVTTARSIIAGAGLTGGGTLAADRTIDVNPGDGIQIVADAVAVDSTVVRTTRTLSGVGAIGGGGDLSANRTFSLTLASPSGLSQAGDALAIDDALAGDGLGITDKVMHVRTGGGLSITADDVHVNLAYGFNWTGAHAFANTVTMNAGGFFNAGVFTFNAGADFASGVFTFSTDPQVAANLDFIGGARSITGDGNITIAPAGDLVLSPVGLGVLPGGSYQVDLGDYNRKFRTLFVAELYTENLVAQDVMATIGGRVLVTPTTSLIADMTDVQTTIQVKHNNFANNMYIRLENAPGGVPQFEVMRVTSASTPVAGGYQYNVTRNLDGTGANFWLAGDGVASLRTSVGEGWIDLASSATVLNDLGPTITIYSRSSAANWDDVAPVVAMGNLESFVDYGSTEFGFAVGNNLALDASSGFSGITADRTDGIRMFNVDIEMFSGATKVSKYTDTEGIVFRMENTIEYYNSITWRDDIDSIISQPYFQIAASRDIVDPTKIFGQINLGNFPGVGSPGPGPVTLAVGADGEVGGSGVYFLDTAMTLGYYAVPGGPKKYAYMMINDNYPNHILLGHTNNHGHHVASTVEVFTDHSDNDATSGLTITGGQTTVGDALLHWRVLSSLIAPGTVEQAWTMGIDRSDGNSFKINMSSLLNEQPPVRISTSGSVALGFYSINVPTLEVVPSSYVQIRSASAARLYAQGNIAINDELLADWRIWNQQNPTNPVAAIEVYRSNSATNSYMVFKTRNGGDAVERMRIDRDGKLTTTTSEFHQFTRTSSATSSFYSILALKHQTSANMVDGLGAGLLFQIRDSAAVDNNVGFIGAERNGADDIGALEGKVYNGGSPIDVFRFEDAAGWIYKSLNLESTLTIGTGSGTAAMTINGGAGSGRETYYRTNNSLRWRWGVNGDAESGSNAGSNFVLLSYSDGGAFLGTPIEITRATGKVTLSGELDTNGGIRATGGSGNERIRHTISGNGGAVIQSLVDTDNGFLRAVFSHNAYWHFEDNLWYAQAIGANDVSAIVIDGAADMNFVFFSSTGNSNRSWTNANFLAGTRAKLDKSGNFQIDGVLTADGGINVGEDTMVIFDGENWTPTLSEPGSSFSYADQQGRYLRKNNAVEIQGTLRLTSVTGTAGVVSFNLPFTNSMAEFQTLSAIWIDGSVYRATSVVVQPGNSLAYIVNPVTGGLIEGTELAASDWLIVGGTYFLS